MSKKNEAAIRRKLNDHLKAAEDEARDVLSVVNRLRHGQLEALAQVPAAINQARRIAKTLKGLTEQMEAA